MQTQGNSRVEKAFFVSKMLFLANFSYKYGNFVVIVTQITFHKDDEQMAETWSI